MYVYMCVYEGYFVNQLTGLALFLQSFTIRIISLLHELYNSSILVAGLQKSVLKYNI